MSGFCISDLLGTLPYLERNYNSAMTKQVVLLVPMITKGDLETITPHRASNTRRFIATLRRDVMESQSLMGPPSTVMDIADLVMYLTEL